MVLNTLLIQEFIQKLRQFFMSLGYEFCIGIGPPLLGGHFREVGDNFAILRILIMRLFDHFLPVPNHWVALGYFERLLLLKRRVRGNYSESIIYVLFAAVSLGRQNSEAPETDTRLHHLVS